MRILINTEFEDSGCYCPDSICVADAILRTLDGTNYSVLEIRVVVPSEHAQELLLGMLAGRAEVTIDDIRALPDLNPPDLTTN
jgi:hypothetical protein